MKDSYFIVNVTVFSFLKKNVIYIFNLVFFLLRLCLFVLLIFKFIRSFTKFNICLDSYNYYYN